MTSLLYPLCHDCSTDLLGMAWMQYPPTIYKDYSELLLRTSIRGKVFGIVNLKVNII